MGKKIQTSINELLDGDSGCCYMSKGAQMGVCCTIIHMVVLRELVEVIMMSK